MRHGAQCTTILPLLLGRIVGLGQGLAEVLLGSLVVGQARGGGAGHGGVELEHGDGIVARVDVDGPGGRHGDALTCR